MSTGASSSVPGSSPMSPTAESLSLGQLISELTTRLTALEKLGLLSAYGLSLMSSLVPKVTPTPSTVGSAGSPWREREKDAFGMFTCPPDSGWRELQKDWRKSLPEGTITCQNPGPTSLQATPAPMTPGSTANRQAYDPSNTINGFNR